jgi:hypothetical protein
LTTVGWFRSGMFSSKGSKVGGVDRPVVKQRGHSLGEKLADKRPEEAEPCGLDERSPSSAQNSGPHVRFERHEVRPPDGAAGIAVEGDPGGIEIGDGVAVDVDAGLDDAHQLHRVDDGLGDAVSLRDERLRRARDGADSLVEDDPGLLH